MSRWKEIFRRLPKCCTRMDTSPRALWETRGMQDGKRVWIGALDTTSRIGSGWMRFSCVARFAAHWCICREDLPHRLLVFGTHLPMDDLAIDRLVAGDGELARPR